MAADLVETQERFLDAIRGAGGAIAGIETWLTRSAALDAGARLQVYADAYWLRLVECLGDQFPACKHLLGAESFDALAAAYITAHPSRRYTLDALGEAFPRWLAASQPADRPDWAALLVDLATLELTIATVFDGEGIEGRATLDQEALAGLDPEAFWAARLAPAPSVATLTPAFPINDLYARLRGLDGPTEDVAVEAHLDPRLLVPPRGPQRLVIYRRDYIVRRYEASEAEMALLEALLGGATVGAGVDAALGTGTVAAEALPDSLHAWFTDWVRLGFFLALQAPAT